MSIILRASNIVKHFHNPLPSRVLDNVSFEVRAGEFLSLQGRSGSGKSTLLYILSTMDTDYEGEMEICGERTTGQPKSRLAALRNERIGFVFQFHYLLPEFTVLQNVMLPAQKLGRYPEKQIRERALAKLELLGVADQAYKLSSRLSGGQQQRVAIARALINDPAIIMGDEPTGNLDSKNAKLVQTIFRDLAHKQGQTLIIVTHDDDFARATDRTIFLSDGRTVDDPYHSAAPATVSA